MKNVKITINSQEIVVPEGTTILEAAKKAQINIPTLCMHSDISSSGACGLCIVKILPSGRMVRSCCTPVEEGMEIITHDPEIVSVRRTVLELILSAHPNDCLKCGRNNNCELQKLVADFGIREEVFDKYVLDLPKDASTGAIVLEPAKCIKCGRCLEICQEIQGIWALSFLNRGFNTRFAPAGDIKLAESPCVKCGQCSAHCPTGAIFEKDEVTRVWEALQDEGLYCVVQIAPAVRVAVGEGFGLEPGTNLTKKIYALLRRLGFKAVFDTNFGADVTVMEEAKEFTERFLKKTAPLPLFTSCCPSWVDYMEKFSPDMIEHLSSCKSPHQMLGALAKTYYARKNNIPPEKMFVVSIMPCTSKKYEITRSEDMFTSGYHDVDAVLTTRELIRMIKQTGIDFLNLPDEEADSILGEYSGAGVIFGASGGVMEAALRTAYYFITCEDLQEIEFKQIRGLDGVKAATVDINGKKINIAVVHGLGNVESILNQLREEKQQKKEPSYHFVEVMACRGGCIGGGGQPYGVTDGVRLKRAQGLYEDDRHRQVRFSHHNPFIKKLYEEFLKYPLSPESHKLLHTKYKERPLYVR